MENELQESADALDYYLLKINKISYRLQKTGILLLAITLTNIGVLLAMSARIINIYNNDPQLFSLLLLILCLSTIALALHYDIQRREGNILFEEISNELHGKGDVEMTLDEFQKYKNKSLRAKIELRGFTHNSELPLIPGRYGPAILAAINLFIFLVYLALTLPK